MNTYCKRIIFLFGILCGLPIFCEKKYQIIEEKSYENKYHYRLKNFVRTALDSENRLQYKIEAVDGYSYNDRSKKRFIVYDFIYSRYGRNQNILYSIHGGRGEFDGRDRWMYIQDGAKYENMNNGLIVSSKELRYDIAFGILASDTRVEILEKRLRTICRRGMIIDRAKSYRVCFSPLLSP